MCCSGRNALEDSDNVLVVSAASAWEIATKWRLGTLQHSDDLVLASTDPAFSQFEGVVTLG